MPQKKKQKENLGLSSDVKCRRKFELIDLSDIVLYSFFRTIM